MVMLTIKYTQVHSHAGHGFMLFPSSSAFILLCPRAQRYKQVKSHNASTKGLQAHGMEQPVELLDLPGFHP